MPTQRISKPFKDVSATFQINPLNSDLIGLKNANAISRSIRNLVLTIRGEKPFDLSLGSNVNNLLFENLDFITASSIKSEIENTIRNYEPRVKLNDVFVKANTDRNAFDVQITYDIIGIEIDAQDLSFSLELTR
jgi:phage baseplate assembly protein W|tara:strand:+ start:1657 stop:2058 length:402 start_codon:yes stop_codon:yes gene_type:complete